MNRVVVVMGVSGCGKSTVARLVSERLGWELLEGDDLHPRSNVEKMSHGIPLNDEDRQPWLEAIAHWINRRITAGQPGVVTCSCLKRHYRDIVRGDSHSVVFAHLSGSKELLARRMGARTGHFMPSSLLESQLATLEPLQPDEPGIVIDIGEDPQDEADEIVRWLRLDVPNSASAA